ncbi:chorismate mutase 1, chloroplastic-like isoform X1 [Henckelia pumila]|uniref:chorismate mutase 1, chloroplastic-like isoform X1 n=1 Tax=Henckelia pumila TaxID=405737 RepID=UPI003C6E088F
MEKMLRMESLTNMLFTSQTPNSRHQKRRILPIQISASRELGQKTWIEWTQGIRDTISLQEDTIVNNLWLRSPLGYNADIYARKVSSDGFQGSSVERLVRDFENFKVKFGGKYNREERFFFLHNIPNPPLHHTHDEILHPASYSININPQIWDMYIGKILPRLVKKHGYGYGDGDKFMSAELDKVCLLAISRRIHYSTHVAEASFRAAPDVYEPAIIAQDRALIMDLVMHPAWEEATTRMMKVKFRNFEELRHWDEYSTDDKIDPSLVPDLYGRWIMPLTRQVQVEYLLKRLD